MLHARDFACTLIKLYSMTNPIEIRLPVDAFLPQPIPVGKNCNITISNCYVPVDRLPVDLKDWLGVNPRIPKFSSKNKLTGVVAKGIIQTLQEEPEKFVLKNQGIYLSVASTNHHEGILTLTLNDKKRHGVINGGHTLRSILEVRENSDNHHPGVAHVRLHIYQLSDEVDISLIADMAEGLNRSLQVDDPSLENLKGSFERIKSALQGKRGSNEVSYHQNDPGNFEITEILTLCCLFNLDKYRDRQSYPNGLFGHRKIVLKTFLDDAGSDTSAFDKILTKLHDILVLSERIQQELGRDFGKIKNNNKTTNNRIGSDNNKRDAYFIDGNLAELPLGFIYPLVGAFRANICPIAWDHGEFEWLEDPEILLRKCGKELANVIKQQYSDNKGKPAEVGNKVAAYQGCYSIIALALAEEGKLRQVVTV